MASDLLLWLVDEEKCYEILRSYRWPEGVRCLACGSDPFHRDFEEYPKLQYHCQGCSHWWTDFTGTVFEGTKLPLSKWFLAIDLYRQGKAAKAVVEELRMNRTTAMRIRTVLFTDLWVKRLQDTLHGEVEADEVYVTAGSNGLLQRERPARVRGLKQRGRGTWDSDKPPVIGVVERESGEVRLEVCHNAQKKPATRS